MQGSVPNLRLDQTLPPSWVPGTLFSSSGPGHPAHNSVLHHFPFVVSVLFLFISFIYFIIKTFFFCIKVTHAHNLKCSFATISHFSEAISFDSCSAGYFGHLLLNNLLTWLLDFPLRKCGVIQLSFLPSFIFTPSLSTITTSLCGYGVIMVKSVFGVFVITIP